MSKRNLAGFLVFMLIVSTAITVSTWVKATNQGKQIDLIERRLVEVQYPCTEGRDANCQRFLNILLSSATKRQLERLLRARELRVPEAELDRFLDSIERRERRARTPRGSLFGPPKVTLPNAPRVLTPQPEVVMPDNPNNNRGLSGRR
jgi:hypothetical protein